MHTRIPEGLRLTLLIILPVVLAALAFSWLTDRMLVGISNSVDAQERQRAWQAVQSAFKAQEAHLAGVIADNAHWDDAARNSYSPVNTEWLAATWGDFTGDVNYDVAAVAEADGKVLAAYKNGKRFALSTQDYFGDSFAKLLAELPGDNHTFRAASSLVKTPDGLMAVAAGPILPTSENDLVVPTAKANVLLFGHFIKDQDLAEMGSQYIVDGLHYVPLAAQLPAIGTLRDTWGNPVAELAWQDRHPGAAASESYGGGAIALLLGLIAVMLPITAVHIRTTRQLSAGRRKAQIDAGHDRLTGLPNRAQMMERLAAAVHAANPDVVLLYVDLDGFKSVNDTYGHSTGDRLLRIVSAGFRHLAGEALLARLGGDEFAAMLAGGDAVGRAEKLASDIVKFIKEPFEIEGRSCCVGASIGLARAEAGLDESEIMRRADVAMYEAKEQGRGLWRWFNPELDAKKAGDQQLAAEMRKLVAQGTFEVAYQPIVNAASRQITGVEALARWPKDSNVAPPPDRFIRIAEENGIIDDLGSLILRLACRDAAQWQGIGLSVNVSPLQLNNRGFVAGVKRIAEEEAFDLTRLELEFTETILIRNAQRARQVMRELHALGIKVALDDFGTGFASIGYLRSFAFDRVKLDRSLTNGVVCDDSSQKIVQGTVLIAQGLSADIVAEGVESEEQAQILRLTGCRHLQGYHLGHPGPAAALDEALRASDEGQLLAAG